MQSKRRNLCSTEQRVRADLIPKQAQEGIPRYKLHSDGGTKELTCTASTQRQSINMRYNDATRCIRPNIRLMSINISPKSLPARLAALKQKVLSQTPNRLPGRSLDGLPIILEGNV